MPSTSIVLPPFSPNNPAARPCTYHNNAYKQADYRHECYVTRTTNFEKISAWLDRTDMLTHVDDDLLYIDDVAPESTATTPVEADQQGTTIGLLSLPFA